MRQVWQARQELFDSEGAVVLKASLLPGDVCALSSELQQMGWERRTGDFRCSPGDRT